jgi:hypothetical protein
VLPSKRLKFSREEVFTWKWVGRNIKDSAEIFAHLFSVISFQRIIFGIVAKTFPEIFFPESLKTPARVEVLSIKETSKEKTMTCWNGLHLF